MSASVCTSAVAGLCALFAASAAPALADSCPNAQFRTGFSANLPDCRAYEQVTPADKSGAGLNAIEGAAVLNGFEAATNGDRFGYSTFENQPGASSPGLYYLDTRGAGGWSQKGLIPPQSTAKQQFCPFYVDIALYSTDLSRAILADGYRQNVGCGKDDPSLSPNEPQATGNLFLRDNNTDAYQLLTPNPISGVAADAHIDDGSADLSHVVFDENAQLAPDAPSGQDNLYDWSGGTLKLVAELPTTGTSCSGSACSPVGGAHSADFGRYTFEHAVSDYGSRILFTAGSGFGNIYDRIDGTRTVQVDAAAPGAPGPGGLGQFLWATTDGSRVFFSDDASQGLTSDTVAGSGANFYEYDVDTGGLTDLTPAGDARVLGVSGVGDDGSYVYFVAEGALASGATAGQPNLYLHHGGATRFIATLGSADQCDWQVQNCTGNFGLTSRVSPSGAFLAFNSVNSLTGYDNAGHNEIYLYDAAAGELSCASCDPSGAAATTDTEIAAPPQMSIGNNLVDTRFPQRYVSGAGQVFFDTTASLLPADTDGLSDVYEYENGQLHLITTGTSTFGSRFLDATPSGSDVYVGTAQQLVAQDADDSVDIYDARVGGGFPAPATPTPCSGDACRSSAPSPAPATIGTIAFAGQGNATSLPARGPAGSVRVMRRTVRRATLALSVRVPGRGRVTVSGASVRTVSRSVPRAGSYRIAVRLNPKGKRALERKHRLRLVLRARYAPAAAATAVTGG